MRERPAGGGIVWHARANAFECQGCADLIPVRRQVWTNPERLILMRELVVLDHTECWEYDDPRMARLQRKFRKGVKRQKLLMGRNGNDRGHQATVGEVSGPGT